MKPGYISKRRRKFFFIQIDKTIGVERMTILREISAVLGLCMILTAMAASAADFTLSIYGNANMDDTINDQDTAYVQDVIHGTKAATNLSDANHDGTIDEKDIDQIKQIIDGTEKKLVVQDDAGDAIAIDMPVASAITGDRSHAEAMRAIKATDRIIAVTKGIEDQSVFFPELSKLPSVASEYGKDPDWEAILNLKPTIYITQYADDKKQLPRIQVVLLKLWEPSGFEERIVKLGYIFDRRDEAIQYIKWHNDTIESIKDRIEGQSEKSQPRILLASVYADGIHVHTNRSGGGQIPDIIGVKILGGDLIGSHPLLDSEWVIKQNPEVILLLDVPDSVKKGYNTSDTSEMAAYRNDFMNNTIFKKLDAVKNKRVYVLDGKSMTYSGSYILSIAYMAKLFYPEVFRDFDPRVVHQEYLKLQGLDYNLKENGIFVYPPIEGK